MDKPWHITVMGKLQVRYEDELVSEKLTRPQCIALLGYLVYQDALRRSAPIGQKPDHTASMRTTICSRLFYGHGQSDRNNLSAHLVKLDAALLGRTRRGLVNEPHDYVLGRGKNWLELNADAVMTDVAAFCLELGSVRPNTPPIERIARYALALSRYAPFLPELMSHETAFQDGHLNPVSGTTTRLSWHGEAQRSLHRRQLTAREDLRGLVVQTRKESRGNNGRWLAEVHERLQAQNSRPDAAVALTWLEEFLKTEQETIAYSQRDDGTVITIGQSAKDDRSVAPSNEEIVRGKGANYRQRSFQLPPQEGGTLSPLFGRADELAQLREAILSHRDCPQGEGAPSQRRRRLFSLVGPSGVGKTRLAAEVLKQVEDDLAGRACFVSLAYTPDAESATLAVLNALPIQQNSDAPLDQIIAGLQNAPWLLVLDGLEYLINEGEASWLAYLLERCPQLVCLVTSQRQLGIAAEQSVEVKPLGQNESVQMFMDHAQSQEPTFQVDAVELDVITNLCSKLDGLPLAIELAARRIRTHSPQQMLDAIDLRFTWLKGQPSDLEPRHRSLQAALDWSNDLLGSPVRDFFACLSVFRGSWSIEAAAAVGGIDGEEALEYLEQLAQSHFVVSDLHSSPRRFSMLDTLRLYGEDHLGDKDLVKARHANYFKARAHDQFDYLHGPTQREALSLLEHDKDNYWAALAWYIKQQRKEDGLLLCAELTDFWHIRGYWQQAYLCLESLFKLPGEVDPLIAARAFNGGASIYRNLGHLRQSLQLYRRARKIYQRRGDHSRLYGVLVNIGRIHISRGRYRLARYYCTRGVQGLEGYLSTGQTEDKRRYANGLLNLGIAEKHLGDFATAILHTRQALALYQELQCHSEEASALCDLAFALYRSGSYDEAQQLLSNSLAIRKRLNEPRGIADVIAHQGICSRQKGDLTAAKEYFLKALGIYEELGDAWCIGCMYENLCAVAINEDQFDIATEYGARALHIKRTLQAIHPLGVTLAHLGFIGHFRGDTQSAIRYLLEALDVFGKARLFGDTPECLYRLAQTYVKEQRWEQATIAYVAADVMRQQTTCPPAPIESEQLQQLTDILNEHMGDKAIDAIRCSLTNISCLQIIRHVLQHQRP